MSALDGVPDSALREFIESQVGPIEVMHRTTVTYQRGWGEWRPECTCGWVGSYWSGNGMADIEAGDHIAAAALPGTDKENPT